jgi:hypothetical protein
MLKDKNIVWLIFMLILGFYGPKSLAQSRGIDSVRLHPDNPSFVECVRKLRPGDAVKTISQEDLQHADSNNKNFVGFPGGFKYAPSS